MPEDRPPFSLTIALGLFGLAWFVLAGPWLIGSVTIPWDGKAHWYPHLVFASAAFHGGENAAWTPNIFAGSPEIADPQSVLFSVPLLLLALLRPSPSLLAMDWAVFLMLLAGGAAVIMLFRDRGWHWGGALVAAIAFAFGAAASWRLQHLSQVFSLCWWAISWWLLSRALNRTSLVHGVLAGLAAGALLLGRDQVAMLSAYLLAGVVLDHWLRAQDRGAALRASLLPLTVAAITCLLVAALPVLMSALWGSESNRVVIDLEGAGRGSLHPAHLLTLAIGNLYGAAGMLANHWGPPSPTWGDTGLFLARNMGVLYSGAIPFFLILATICSGAAFRSEIRFVTAALVLMLLYALGWYTPALPLFWHVPGIDLFRRPADAVFVIGGLAAILAGYGAHLLLTGRLATRWIVETGIAFLLVILAMMLILWKQAPMTAWVSLLIGIVTLVLSLAILTAARFIKPGLLPLALVAVLVQDLAITNAPSESTALPPQVYDVLQPATADPTVALLKSRMIRDGDRRDRVELIGLGYPWQNAALSHGFEDTLGFNPVRSAAYANLVGAEDIAALPGQRRFPPAFPSYRSPLADILGLRFIVSGVPINEVDKTLASDAFLLVARTPDAYIYENARALPRVWVTPATAPTPPDLATAGFPAGLDPRETVLIEGPALPRRSGGTARIAAYGNTEIVVETETTDGGTLVLADAWHPWWRARISGAEVPVRRAYGLVRAVEVPAGRATVRFAFEPVRSALAQLSRR
ncbi:MAG: hypothetical protein JNK84_11315 [Phreatobacter sp.]|uniref:hypothetical protein n=1 Tax=Phreatobacter sp. TaxID=1966341 RepID=UPI001A4D4B35|nr:hypothetical protein [Phreatobacter sp.]MBL8569658.1 hypothetical protein [Phreatobacter sp.]